MYIPSILLVLDYSIPDCVPEFKENIISLKAVRPLVVEQIQFLFLSIRN